MAFAHRTGTGFWSNEYAWGTATISEHDVKLTVLKGTLSLKELTIGKQRLREKTVLNAGESTKLSYGL
ncbi:MAG: hypothetical protein Q4E55_04460 [Bacteroidales bacterium]|nr:hypothetical protein [Bacteroidales bacterium]